MKFAKILLTFLITYSLQFTMIGQNLGTEINHEEIKIDISDNQQPYPANFKDWWTIAKGSTGDLEITRIEFASDIVTLQLDLLIDKSTGNVSIGTFDSDTDLHIYQEGNSAATSGIRLDDGTDEWNIYIKGSSEHDLAFSHNGTIKAEIETNGNYVVGSDRRLKTNIEPMQNVLGKVLNFQPVRYQYRGYEEADASIGFIAQDIEKYYPELVYEIDKHKALAYDQFSVLAIKAIQEQQKMIETLERKVKALEAQNEKISFLEHELNKLVDL